jgi:hypothetical protein
MDDRSILGSYASALHLPVHKANFDARGSCTQCGARAEEVISPSHHLVRRLMWAGNVEQGTVPYVLSDLESFAARKPPDKRDTTVLETMIERILGLEEGATLTDLEKSIANLFPSNKGERRTVLEILGFCGVLKPREFESPHLRWVPHKEYPLPDHFYAREWRAPVSCWKGKDGVNQQAYDFWFGE